MKCPFCADEIEPGVLKCRHCGEWLELPESENHIGCIHLICFFFWPIGLLGYLMLLGSNPRKAAKLGEAAIVGFLFFCFVWFILNR